MKSLAELQAIKEKMQGKVALREGSGDKRVVVGMATCGIAAGARPVLNAFVEQVNAAGLTASVTVTQTGCIGICQFEPVVEVFEAGKEKVGKKGVVREPETHKEVLDDFVALAAELEFKILGLTFSPVKGPEGNIEFLGHLTLADQPGIMPDTAGIVDQAHQTLRG